MRVIDFVNGSSGISARAFREGVAALQRQVDNHFQPAWGFGADLVISNTLGGHPAVIVLDSWDDADALGHDDDMSVAVGFVFTDVASVKGEPWTFNASHELLEMLVDPRASLLAQAVHGGRPAFFAYEACDPVEWDGGYEIGGLKVSNFVFPSWFVGLTSERYDWLSTLDAPLSTPNGHMSYFHEPGAWLDAGRYPAEVTRYSRLWRRGK